MAKKGKGSKAAVTAVVDEDDDLELEELEDDEEEVAPPKKAKKKKAKGGAQAEVTFGAADLAAHLTELTGKEVTPRSLRTQLRRMARDGRIQREVIAGNKARYDWPDGLDDPEVKAIIKAVQKGEIEESKREALAQLKERGAKKKAAEMKAKKKAPVVEDDDEEDEDEDDE